MLSKRCGSFARTVLARLPAGRREYGPAAKDHVAAFLRAARPLSDWLEKNVGPSTMDRPAR
jgi:hypothetical protein